MFLEALGVLFAIFCILGICVFALELMMLRKMLKR